MNKKQMKILKLQEDFRDTLENEFVKIKQNTEIKILDVKLVGQLGCENKTNGQGLQDCLFEVEREVIEEGTDGKTNKKVVINYYLGSDCIAGALETKKPIYSSRFENLEPEKLKAVNDLLNRTTEKEIEDNSLNKLQRQEVSEILTAYLGRKVTEEEVEKIINNMDSNEIQEIKKEKEIKDGEENTLSKNQKEKIGVSGIQRIELDEVVDGEETLGKKLDLEDYTSLEVINTERVNDIASDIKRNNTAYSIVGMKKDGTAKVLNEEFELDHTTGNNGSRQQSKIRADGTATRDNKDVSVYTRKSNGVSIGFENDQGIVNAFYYEKTVEENENVGIQIETSKTEIIEIETKQIMDRDKGIYQKDKVQDEIKEHTDNECSLEDEKDFDGDSSTGTHEHVEDGNKLSNGKSLADIVLEIYNYENDTGEEKIKELFTKQEIEEKFLRELAKDRENLSLEQIIENVKEEMNEDAEILTKEHDRR